jgi:hypothetical protein
MTRLARTTGIAATAVLVLALGLPTAAASLASGPANRGQPADVSKLPRA